MKILKLKNRKKVNFKILYYLFAMIFVMSVGFAYVQSSLSIKGVANIEDGAWNIYFDNLTKKHNMTTMIPAAINTMKDTITFNLTLETKLDYYEFEVDVVNRGDLDAEISEINLTGLSDAQKKYLSYTYSYSDGIELKEHDSLKSGEQDTLKVRVEFMVDITVEDLPSEVTTINLSFSLTYRQDVGNGVEREKNQRLNYAYVGGNIYLNIGETIQNGMLISNTAEDAMKNWGHPFYVKHKLNADNVIEESYVEFIITEEMASANEGMQAGTYTLRGGDGGASYESNKEILLSAFGSDYCRTDDSDGFSSYFNCSVDDLYVSSNSEGRVSADAGAPRCVIYWSGGSRCEVRDNM